MMASYLSPTNIKPAITDSIITFDVGCMLQESNGGKVYWGHDNSNF